MRGIMALLALDPTASIRRTYGRLRLLRRSVLSARVPQRAVGIV